MRSQNLKKKNWADVFKFVISERKWRRQAAGEARVVKVAVGETLAKGKFMFRELIRVVPEGVDGRSVNGIRLEENIY